MVYNVWGPKQVENATRLYNETANNAPVYRDSAATNAARTEANAAANRYADAVNNGYKSQYGNQINALAKRYQSNTFDWKAENSADYQAQKDYYRREGQKAQENVQGAYAANTGGYSNSFAQAAGQRAYGDQMEALAQKIPALRSSAFADWNQKQEQTMNQIGLLKGFDDAQYARFRDNVNDLYSFMQYYQQKYSTERGLDMTAFGNELSNWQARLSAAQNNLSSVRSLAESQYEHNSVSADAQASLNQQTAQNNAYYNYLYSRLNKS